MRNFFHQFADGFFSSLDVMNYIQHHAAVLKMKPGDRVLDVCCGRGLLLPLIRYYRPKISEYVGIDISGANIKEQTRRSGIKMIDDMDDYYPFKVTHVVDSVESITDYFEPNSFDFIVYTSAIEHMQKEVGFKSLEQCYEVLKPRKQMFLSCPNTSDKKDPYDTQYAAHVYEWGLNELKDAIHEVGFAILDEWGLVGKVKDFEKAIHGKRDIKRQYLRLKRYLPTQWLMAFMPLLYPEAAAEILLIIQKEDQQKL